MKRGPGKFSTDLDAYAYGLTLDGGPDEEESYHDGGGWYGLLWVDGDVRRELRKSGTLGEKERALLDKSVAVILHERSDGGVETEWFDNAEDVREAWSNVREEFEAEEGVV